MLFSRNYPRILHHEFTKRVEKNPRYSLRAFSKHLGISPARLSNVLSGKKGLSEEAARGIAAALLYDAEQTEFFCALVNSVNARSKAKRDEFSLKVDEYVRKHRTLFMQVSAFEAISDVRHLVLLQVLKIKKVQAPLAVSLLNAKEELSIQQQAEMIERMIQLGMVQVQDGFYSVVHTNFSGPDLVSSASLKRFHQQVLDHAKESVVQEPIEVRDSFFLTLPFEQNKLPEVRDKIRKFVSDLVDQYGHQETADSVYGLSSQFFPFERITK